MKYLSRLNKKYLKGKTCLLRLDLNVQNNELSDSLRVGRSVPTILFLIKNGCKVVILSHKGRPNHTKQRISNKEPSLKSIGVRLSDLIGQKVHFFGKLNFLKIKNEIAQRSLGEVFMLENLRFNKGEESNSRNFAKKLASLGNIYVNDAFAVSHRKNASICAITGFLPSYAGLEIESELDVFKKVLKNPRKPLTIILGGAKISDKVEVIKKFYLKAFWILTGGGVANTFFFAKGIPVGKSLYDNNSLKTVKKWLKSKKIIMPEDLMISGGNIMDIGRKTVDRYSKIIKKSKTVIWNGPMGYIEDPKFQSGTIGIAKALKQSKAFSVVGGGETTYLILEKKLEKNASFLSVGGGAMLEYLSGRELPGIKALEKSKNI
jgi:3-phosphoglycerate kinase